MTRKSEYDSYCLPKSVVGWIYNHSTKNYWRVAGWCELDDLIQDGLLVAYRCQERYGESGKDIDPPHFMALVKTAFYRHITEMLRHSRADHELVSKIGDLAGDYSESHFLDRVSAEVVEPMQDLAADLSALIARMPKALRDAVMLYIERPEDMRRRKAGRVVLDDEDETDTQRLTRLTGFPARFDFETELRAFLWESQHADALA